jgi:hypothetical protein
MGARGPKKGTVYKPTLDKAQAREALRAVVMEHMTEMTAAQIAHAKGLKYLVARNVKTGKFERVTQAMLDAADEQQMERIEVWEKDPSVQAYTDLMNRTLDKPAEQVDMHVTGELDIVSRLQAARQRVQR